MTTGLDVYRRLMDLDLLLQDGEKMATLHLFLTSVKDDHPALLKLDTEVKAFKSRVEGLIAAVQMKTK